MANEEHLAILKQGVEAWNEWRELNKDVRPELANAELGRANLRGANLSDADLGSALLIASIFNSANLAGADFSRAATAYTVICDVDLSSCVGLESVFHVEPSTIGIDTLYSSKGKIPQAFLRKAGVDQALIDYIPSLISGDPIKFYSCFISYSSKNDEFAQRLHADLQAKNVRVWFAEEDLKIGDKFAIEIDEQIRIRDKVMMILSEESINSPWVQREVKRTLAEEERRGETVLFPIRIDDALDDCVERWAFDLMRERHIGDFVKAG